jgi:hypothetical protein
MTKGKGRCEPIIVIARSESDEAIHCRAGTAAAGGLPRRLAPARNDERQGLL